MRICHIFIFLSVCLLSCQTDHTSCEFAGTYKTQGFYNGTTLNLRFDHSFKLTASHSNCFGGEKQYIVEGIFSTSDDKVFLSPSHFHIAQYQDGPEPGQQDRKLEQDTIYALSAIYDTMLEYEDTLQVVRWNGRMFILGANQGMAARRSYRVYSNSLIKPLNLINRNPKVVTNYYGKEHILNNFWSKLCDDCEEGAIEKALPPEWADFVLKVPINARVIDMKKITGGEYIDSRYVATLNVGHANQIRPGMMFLTEKSVEKQYSVTVTDVFEKTSKGILIAVGVKPEPNVPLTTFEEKAEWDF